VSPAKMAAPIEMPFGLRTRVGPRKHVLDGDPDPPMRRETAEPIEMSFGLWAWMGLSNHVLDRGLAVLRDVAMATNFGMQFATTGFVGYNFGCMIASDMQFASRGGFSGQAI